MAGSIIQASSASGIVPAIARQLIEAGCPTAQPWEACRNGQCVMSGPAIGSVAELHVSDSGGGLGPRFAKWHER